MERRLTFFEKYLTLWVALCLASLFLGALFRRFQLDMPQCSRVQKKLMRSEV